MINFAMQPVNAVTQGNKSGTVGKIGLGFLQGSQLSSTLFYVYMDTFPGWLKSKVPTNSQTATTKETAGVLNGT